MKIISEPKIYLVGRQTVDDGELKRFLADHEFSNWSTDSPSDAETLVEVAARTCYQSFRGGRSHADHIHHLLEVQHGSCIEHAVWNLLITGVSRSLTHELVRHRAGFGFSQLSQRYVDESVAEYVEPDIIANDPELHAIWEDAIATSHSYYVRLADELAVRIKGRSETRQSCPKCGKWEMMYSFSSDGNEYDSHGWACVDFPGGKCDHKRLVPSATDRRKLARQAARSVLPNATETKIFVTANARALRNFLEQRGSRHAEPEIRKLANAVLDVLVKDSPNLFEDMVRTVLPDGTHEITTPFKKV